MLMERKINVVLALCLLSLWAATLSDAQNAIPSEHGLIFEKNPGEASSSMIAFFGRPKVELPEAQNVADPVMKPRHMPTDTVQSSNGSGRNTMPAILIAGIVFAVLGVGLLVAAGVAYMLHSRQSSKTSTSSSPLVRLTYWRGDSEVRLGGVV